jgi:hypothetical protein
MAVGTIMDSAIKTLSFASLCAFCISVILAGYGVYLWITGIAPVLFRLGNGLAKRRVAIFAKNENLESLKHLLLDSKLFRAKNILEVAKPGDIGRIEGASIYLVYWPDWATQIDAILEAKPDKCALVVYAPYENERIPSRQMKALDGKRHTAVTNFRGRLLYDIVVSMITTSYDKK